MAPGLSWGDGQKALFLINEGDEKFPNLCRLAVEEHKDPSSREQGSDAPGRAYSGVGEIRSAVGETDWHELEQGCMDARYLDKLVSPVIASLVLSAIGLASR
jgi:protein required for attachment to host cells